METYDVIIVGAGPGGYDLARILSSKGKRALLIEKDNLGGVCTNCGCIPTKSLLNGAKTYFHAKNGNSIGVDAGNISYNLENAMSWKEETIKTLRDGIAFELKNAKVDTVFGEAEILDAHTVHVCEETYSCTDLVLATGSRPFLPPIDGIDSEYVKTSTDILNMTSLPGRVAVIGGGVIGIEFASYFSMLGTEVAVIEMLDEILPMTDCDIAKIVKREMKGVSFNLGCRVNKIDKDTVWFTDAKQNEKSIQADAILIATGRKANSEVASVLGLELNRNKTIKVDANLRTSVDHVWAIGDVNGLSQLAHSASEMARICAENILGGNEAFDAVNIPWAVYSNPEVAGCGLTQKKAEDLELEVKTSSFMLRGNGRFLAENGKRAGGLIKVIADAKTETVLGVHMVGSYASEIIWGVSEAVSQHMTKRDILSVVFPHPSVSEAFKTAVEML